jgi:hypothetical protein
MFCSQCGQQIVPMNANFCWSCGLSLRGGPPAGTAAVMAWEQCQLIREYRLDDIVPSLKAYVTFVALASGPAGQYMGARSPVFEINPSFSHPDCVPKENDSGARHALDEVTNRLVAEGWEVIGDGEFWFNRQFRRRLA